MKLRILTVIALLGMIISLPAMALDLQEARNAGLVGEALTGYVEPVVSRPDVNALVEEINAKRKQEYARISEQNGQPVSVVAKLAAEQIIKRLGTGHYYKAVDGSWQKR